MAFGAACSVLVAWLSSIAHSGRTQAQFLGVDVDTVVLWREQFGSLTLDLVAGSSATPHQWDKAGFPDEPLHLLASFYEPEAMVRLEMAGWPFKSLWGAVEANDPPETNGGSQQPGISPYLRRSELVKHGALTIPIHETAYNGVPVRVVPCYPIWLGLFLDSTIFAAVGAFATHLYRAMRTRRRHATLRCISCGHQLGSQTLACPECGQLPRPLGSCPICRQASLLPRMLGRMNKFVVRECSWKGRPNLTSLTVAALLFSHGAYIQFCPMTALLLAACSVLMGTTVVIQAWRRRSSCWLSGIATALGLVLLLRQSMQLAELASNAH